MLQISNVFLGIFLTQSLAKDMQHFLYFNQFRIYLNIIFFREYFEVKSQQNIVLKPISKTQSDVQTAGEFGIIRLSATFGNICGNFDTCFAKLSSQAEKFFSWKIHRQLINEQRQIMRLFPNLQISKILHFYIQKPTANSF
jgi:hypothetical protein